MQYAKITAVFFLALSHSAPVNFTIICLELPIHRSRGVHWCPRKNTVWIFRNTRLKIFGNFSVKYICRAILSKHDELPGSFLIIYIKPVRACFCRKPISMPIPMPRCWDFHIAKNLSNFEKKLNLCDIPLAQFY